MSFVRCERILTGDFDVKFVSVKFSHSLNFYVPFVSQSSQVSATVLTGYSFWEDDIVIPGAGVNFTV